MRKKLALHGIGWIAAGPAVLVLVAFVAFAGAKPGEYARFALFADTAFLLAAFVCIACITRSVFVQVAAGIVVLAFTVAHSVSYEQGFVSDSSAENSRMSAAEEIDRRLAGAGATPVLYVASEPAPYCLPPVNLFKWRLVLLPRDGVVPAGSPAGILVKRRGEGNVMAPWETPTSWANIGFDVAEVGGK
jgi:hypothetical protein